MLGGWGWGEILAWGTLPGLIALCMNTADYPSPGPDAIKHASVDEERANAGRVHTRVLQRDELAGQRLVYPHGAELGGTVVGQAGNAKQTSRRGYGNHMAVILSHHGRNERLDCL